MHATSQVPGLTDGPAIAHPADAAECASQISTEGGSTIQQRKQQKQRQQPALTPPSPPQQQQQQQVRVQVMPQQQDSLGHLHADALQQDDTGAWSGSHFQQPQQHGQHQRAATQPDPQSSAGSPSRHPAQQQQQQGLQQQHQDSLASQQHHHHQHQQQQQSTSAADRAAELSEALRAAEAHTDHGTRQRLMKDIKQQQYKVGGLLRVLCIGATNLDAASLAWPWAESWPCRHLGFCGASLQLPRLLGCGSTGLAASVAVSMPVQMVEQSLPTVSIRRPDRCQLFEAATLSCCGCCSCLCSVVIPPRFVGLAAAGA